MTANESPVTVTVAEEPAWKRVLTVTVAAEEVARQRTALLARMSKGLSVPGFRKGKVPKEMAEKMLGRDLDGEVLQAVIPRALDTAIREQGLKVVGDPSVDDLKMAKGEPLSFRATVEVVPEVEITGYQGLKVTREAPDIDPEAVEQTLDRVRESKATLEPVERPATPGDVVSISFAELDDDGETMKGEPSDMDLELGDPRTPESFTEELTGVVAGDMKKVPLPYPDDYPEAELAGTVRHFHVTVKEVKEKVWPELTDDFAKEVTGEDDMTAEALRERIRGNHEAEARHQAEGRLRDRIVGRLLELNEFDLPEGMVQGTLDRIVEQARQENPELPEEEQAKLREGYLPMVQRRYRSDILIDTVARQESISVTDEDVDAEIAKAAEAQNRPAAKLKAELRKEDGLSRLRRDLVTRRVMERLVELADVTDAPAEKENA